MRSTATFSALIAAASLLNLASCSKQVEIGEVSCAESDRLQWSFRQPSAMSGGSVDLLFVVDTSASLNPERARISSTLPSFVGQLAGELDYRIGVIPAHGGASPHSGRLFAAAGSDVVLSSSETDSATIQSQLSATLSALPGDRDEANGEMMMYSLLKALSAEGQSELRKAGLLRDHSVLAVVLLSDENDQCFDPAKHGYSAFPDLVPSPGNFEARAFARYCEGVTPERVRERLIQVKGPGESSLAAITHLNGGEVPSGGEDAIGHGLIELAQLFPDQLLIPLKSASYSEGLATLGKVAKQQAELETAFPLGDRAVAAESVRVKVDSAPVQSRFIPEPQVVEVEALDAGQPGSLIQVDACPRS